MTTLVSIDGGNEAKADRVCYCSEFEAGELYAMHLLNFEAARKADLSPDRVVVERPKYDGRIARGVPPGVIIDLAWNVSRVAVAIAGSAPIVEITSDDWIGGVAKPVLHTRIVRAMRPSERKHFPPDLVEVVRKAAEHFARTRRVTKHHSYNTLDAFGAGCFDLGRIGKGGTKR